MKKSNQEFDATFKSNLFYLERYCLSSTSPDNIAFNSITNYSGTIFQISLYYYTRSDPREQWTDDGGDVATLNEWSGLPPKQSTHHLRLDNRNPQKKLSMMSKEKLSPNKWSGVPLKQSTDHLKLERAILVKVKTVCPPVLKIFYLSEYKVQFFTMSTPIWP